MKNFLLSCSWCSLALACLSAAEQPVLRSVRGANAGPNLLRNSGFEEVQAGQPTGWAAAPQGASGAPGAGRNGFSALVCNNPAGAGWFGASQAMELNRTNIVPLVIRGWSRAENVSGSADSGYSLYADIVYEDGSPLWGQTAEFSCGTHGWEQLECVILPEKPVRSVTLHCLFRGHAGTVWFDDLSIQETVPGGGAVLFQGVPMELNPGSVVGRTEGKRTILATRDRLKLTRNGDRISGLDVDSRELAARAPSAFMARDAATGSDVYGFSGGECRELGLRLESRFTAEPDHIVVEGSLTDQQHKDRAVTLLFALPIDATGWRWEDDIRRGRVIQGSSEFHNEVATRCGATGTMSVYPVAVIHDERTGLAVAADMGWPAQYRLGYHPATRQLLIAYDFGLVPETRPLAGTARFRFVIYRFDAMWGFRGAWDKLMRIFPDYFVVRAKDQGIWMPFTDISKVEGWKDFGFKFHEGNNNVKWDDANGILSFRYTEPMTWWMTMGEKVPRSVSQALLVRDSLLEQTSRNEGRMARVTQVAAMHDEQGQPAMVFRDEPWCHGAVWSLNPNPFLPGPLNAATVYWNPEIKQRLYGGTDKPQLDGEYLDSLEGYVTADLNFRREHFGASTVPLTFAKDTKRPVLFKGFAVDEFTRWLAEDVHRSGHLMFANGVPYRFTFLCPWLDVLGTETDWVSEGKYRPAAAQQMDLWRTASGAKPYLLLMNTDYDQFDTNMVQLYFERSLFYGMFPGMFSHNASENPYWQNPRWYNRDRPLFKKYLPLIKRVAEAGWQPVTEARCDNASIWVERFGSDQGRPVFFTLFNETSEMQSGVLRLGHNRPRAALRDLLSGENLHSEGMGWAVRLQPQRAMVVALGD